MYVRSLDEVHAVVAVRNGTDWLILDNRTMSLIDSLVMPEYEPRLEFDENGVRQFIAPKPRVANQPCFNNAVFAEGAP